MVDALRTFVLTSVFAVALGVLAARTLRTRHLHHHWPACAFVLVVLARASLRSAVLPLGVATLAATLAARRWHREDMRAGADLAAIAAQRVRPRDALRAGVRRLVVASSRHPPQRCWLNDGELIVGEDARGGAVSIPLGGAGGGTHTLVLGATGSGKTVAQTWIATRAIERGMAAIVVDPKGDDALRAELARAARAAGRLFLAWTPSGACVYNPFARGAPSEIADKLLAGEHFTEPHYLRQAQRYLGHLTRALRGAGIEVSLADVACRLEPDALERLARRLPDADARAVSAYVESLTPRQRGELSGVRDRIAILAESDVARWLDPRTPGARQFDALTALCERAVVYFELRADSHPLLSQMLAAAIVQDLLTACAAANTGPADSPPALVVIDEFAALAAGHVARLFARARSAGVSLVLGTQELSDLCLPAHPNLLGQVLGNVSAVIAHRQVVPSSAELLARLAGTRGAWRGTLGGSGQTTRRRESAPCVEAQELGALPRGWALVTVPERAPTARRARACIARMRSPSCTKDARR